MERRNLWALVILLYVIVMIMEVDSSLHRVGGGQYTWNSDVNFSDWANHQNFYSGDWLYFGFDRSRHNILQVNKSGYENCNDSDFIFNITRGGRDVFQLVKPKPYYFICGKKGYCLKGMKLAVNVRPQPQTPITTASTAFTLKPSDAFTVLVATAFVTFVFKGLTF